MLDDMFVIDSVAHEHGYFNSFNMVHVEAMRRRPHRILAYATLDPLWPDRTYTLEQAKMSRGEALRPGPLATHPRGADASTPRC